MALFQSLQRPDRTRTQLAYMARFYPWSMIEDNTGARELIVYRKSVYLRKHQILDAVNEDMTHILRNFQSWAICWELGNTPTPEEWSKKTDNYLIHIDFRIIKGIGHVAIFSF